MSSSLTSGLERALGLGVKAAIRGSPPQCCGKSQLPPVIWGPFFRLVTDAGDLFLPKLFLSSGLEILIHVDVHVSGWSA